MKPLQSYNFSSKKLLQKYDILSFGLKIVCNKLLLEHY